jgi:hypothetical protein
LQRKSFFIRFFSGKKDCSEKREIAPKNENERQETFYFIDF